MKSNDTPETGGHLIRCLYTIAGALYQDLAKDSPEGDKAFDIRLHQTILMLKRFEKQAKAES